MPTSFADPLAATATLLRGLLAARGEAYAAGATVGTLQPFGASTGAPAFPYVGVFLDGSTAMRGRSATLERVLLRVAVWHSSAYEAYELARLCRALLESYAGGPEVRVFAPGAGPLSTSDPESGSPLSYFTLSALMRPITL